MGRETTPEAQRLLDEAAADYAAHNNPNPSYEEKVAAADRKTAQVMGRIAAQRGANKLWGTPPVEPQDG